MLCHILAACKVASSKGLIKRSDGASASLVNQQRRKQSLRITRVAGRQASRPLLISLKVRRMLKRTSGLYKLINIVHRVSMKLESEFLDCESRLRLFRGTKM